MLFQKMRTKFDINYENLSKSAIEASKTPLNQTVTPTVRKTAPKIGWETSKKIDKITKLPKFDALENETCYGP